MAAGRTEIGPYLKPPVAATHVTTLAQFPHR